ncbi:MAG: cation transporter, partial [Chitinophagaceae bacterium]
SKTETIPVSGNCGMCKSTIEKSAKKAGASEAAWDAATQVLTVTYNSSSSDAAKIQQSIAAAGYDTRDVKASDAAYNKLHDCCKYERAGAAKAACCDAGKCVKEDNCCTAGKCDKKEGKCAGTNGDKHGDCCKGASCEKKS